MYEIPANMMRLIRQYKPVETEGLTLWPVKVKERDGFTYARPSIEFVQQTLPVKYMSLPLLTAYYQIDLQNALMGEAPTGLFTRALLFLALSLKVGEGLEVDERVRLMNPIVSSDDPFNLKAIRFTAGEEEQKEITPIQFQRLRPILAEQNGIRLYSENANPELIEAENDLAAANNADIDVNFEDMISTVATLTGESEEGIDEWPILKLDRRRDAISRVLHFLVTGIGTASGAKYEGGNPYPSPFFNRKRTDSSAVMSIEKFAGGKGLEAVTNSGKLSL